ncbi:MAG: FecR family protein [Mediterranea sp.]|jgi:ferric-dicitrate binding protein FerR (iron transport regulator)|nr:FecR family protein [Mediterranea sp.]
MDKEHIIKYFAGELEQYERIRLLKAIEDDNELRQEFMTYRNLNGLLALFRQPQDIKEGEESYRQFYSGKRQQQIKRAFLRFSRYAAAIALIIAGTWFASYYYFDYKLYSQVQYNTLSVPAGQHATLILSDGTEIWMNARSSIRYPSRFNRKERKIELKGEAYFNVAGNPECPFVVQTPLLAVNVLGTTFNVKCDAFKGSTDVSLLEGSVEVQLNNSPRKVCLKPMQNLNFSNGEVKVTPLENENDFLWKQGILFFDKVLLSEIAKKLEWHYGIKIIIGSEQTGKQVYSGKFRQQDGPYEILRILQKTNGFRLKKNDVDNIIEIK